MSIDHDEARRIAQGLGKTYHLAGDAEIKLVFDAYLDLRDAQIIHSEEVRQLREERDAALRDARTLLRQARFIAGVKVPELGACMKCGKPGECLCADDVEKLISESSLGTPEAAAIREQTPPGVAEAIVARAEEISAAKKNPCLEKHPVDEFYCELAKDHDGDHRDWKVTWPVLKKP